MYEEPTSGPPPREFDIDRPDRFPEPDERPRPFWVLALQFFLLPLSIAAVAVLVYVGVRVLTRSEKGIPELVSDIRAGGRQKKWHAAFQLSTELERRKGKISREEADSVINLFEEKVLGRGPHGKVPDEDPRVGQYLALCLARIADPRSSRPLREALAGAAADPQLRIHCLLALGHLQDPAVIPEIVQQVLLAPDPDGGVRSMAAYTLGSLARADAPKERRGADWTRLVQKARDALFMAMEQDKERQVRWNAAVALAQTGDRRASRGLAEMLDAEAVKKVKLDPADTNRERLPVLSGDHEKAMEQAVRVAGKLGDRSLIPALKKLTSCESRAVQMAAKEALGRLAAASGK